MAQPFLFQSISLFGYAGKGAGVCAAFSSEVLQKGVWHYWGRGCELGGFPWVGSVKSEICYTGEMQRPSRKVTVLMGRTGNDEGGQISLPFLHYHAMRYRPMPLRSFGPMSWSLFEEWNEGCTVLCRAVFSSYNPFHSLSQTDAIT
jgi:hypothetical protein